MPDLLFPVKKGWEKVREGIPVRIIIFFLQA